MAVGVETSRKLNLGEEGGGDGKSAAEGYQNTFEYPDETADLIEKQNA